MKSYIKLLIFLSLIGLVIMVLFVPKNSYAATNYRLEINSEAGINGKAKQRDGYPVTLTITNKKDNFSGDLVITVPKDYEAIGNIVIPIDIAAGTTKEVQFSIPAFEPGFLQMGPTPNTKVQYIRLYEGSWKDKHEVPIDSTLGITPSYIPDNRLSIGVLSEQPDALNYMKLLSFYGNSPEVIKLEDKDIPNDALGLHALDVLIINNYSIASLSKDKQMAIKNWVHDGGQLVIGSTPGLNNEIGELKALLPLNITATKQLPELKKLEELSGTKYNNGALEIATGQLSSNADVIFSEGNNPLVAQSVYGQGTINQVTYDLATSNLTDWKGYQKAWESMTSAMIVAGNQDEEMKQRNSQISQEMSYISTMFQSLAKIPLSVLVISFFIYVFVAAPILYFILKRFDKREWSWIIIPSIAVVCSITLYSIGAKDRIGKIQSNTDSIVILDGQGNGSGYGSLAMLSKDSGNYVLSVDATLNPFPSMGNQYMGMEPTSDVTKFPVIESKAEKTNVTFQDVEYWSPRSVEIRLPEQEYGLFKTDLTYGDGKIQGSISNQTNYDFQELFLVSGNSHIKIGALKSGETKSIDEIYSQNNLFQTPNSQAYFNIYGNHGGFMPNRENDTKERMMNLAFGDGMTNRNNPGPMLMGFSNGNLVDFTVNGKDTKNQSLNLFAQTIEIGISNNLKNSITFNLSTPMVKIINGQMNYNGTLRGENFIDASPGTYEFVYQIPDVIRKANIKLDELIFNLGNGPGTMSAYEILNIKNTSYEAVKLGGSNKLSADQLKNYISENGQIYLRTSSNINGGAIAVPVVVIKGGPNQ